MAKDKERERFKQDLLNMSRFKIRRACIDHGCPTSEVREAETDGEEAMIELLMQKYDAGEVEIPGMTKSKTKNTGKKTTRRAKREPEVEVENTEEPETEPETEPEESEEPDEFDENDLWGDDDLEPEPKDEEPPPKKSVTRKAAKNAEPIAEQSGLEDQMAQLMDLQVTIAENVDALSKTVLKMSNKVEETQKYVVFLKVLLEMGTGGAFKFLKTNKLPNPLKHMRAIIQKAYEKSGLDAPKSDGTRSAKT